jgi:hypothetical protein
MPELLVFSMTRNWSEARQALLDLAQNLEQL